MIMKINEFDKSYCDFKTELLKQNQIDEAIPLPSMMSAAGSMAKKAIGTLIPKAPNAAAKQAIANVARAGINTLKAPGAAIKAVGRTAQSAADSYQQGFKSGYQGTASSPQDMSALQSIIRSAETPEQKILQKMVRGDKLNTADATQLKQMKNNLRAGRYNLAQNQFEPIMDKLAQGELPDMDVEDFETLFTGLKTN